MCLSRSRGVLSQNLLTAERTVSIAPPIAISTYITIYVPDIVFILLVEDIICDFVESSSPKYQTFVK
jgi:hypothetical protein